MSVNFWGDFGLSGKIKLITLSGPYRMVQRKYKPSKYKERQVTASF
jgi:hypothetical protein